MIKIIPKLPKNIVGFEFNGTVTPKDYESTLYPALEVGLKKNNDLDVLCFIAKNFEGFKAGAVLEDLQLGVKYFSEWRKVALVSKKKWINETISTLQFLIPGQVHTFKKKKEAIHWLSE